MGFQKSILLRGGAAILFVFIAGGCKPPVPVKPGDAGNNIMRRQGALWSYKDGKWKALTRVNAGEQIVVTGHREITYKGKTTRYAVGKTTDGTTGLVNPAYLALSAVVITGDNAVLYRRNNAASGKGRGAQNVKRGAVAFVLGRRAEGKWLEVVSGPGPYFKGWLASDQDIGTDTSQIAVAVQLAGVRSALAGKNLNEGKLEELRRDLESLTSKPEPFATAAQELLEEVGKKIEELKNKPQTPPPGTNDGPPGPGGDIPGADG